MVGLLSWGKKNLESDNIYPSKHFKLTFKTLCLLVLIKRTNIARMGVINSTIRHVTQFWPMASAYFSTRVRYVVRQYFGIWAISCDVRFRPSQFNTWVGAIIETCFNLVTSDRSWQHAIHAWLMTRDAKITPGINFVATDRHDSVLCQHGGWPWRAVPCVVASCWH